MVKIFLDIVDVHVTSNAIVDSFTQYPLLDGDKKGYTVECTEFCAPVSTQTALPPLSFFQDDAGNTSQYFFEIRRKRLTADNVHYAAAGSSMPTLVTNPVNLFGVGNNKDYLYKFRKSSQYPCSTIGELIYDLQRFFDDFKGIYTKNADSLDATLHGGGDDEEIRNDTRFVNVIISPNSTLNLVFSPIFTNHFYLVFTAYGQKMFGLPEVIAYRTAGVVLTGLTALTNNAVAGTIIEGGTEDTIQANGSYPLSRYFDHRVRLEIETQIGIPASVVWSTNNVQQLNHIIATFPFVHKIETSVMTNNEGAIEDSVKIQEQLMNGDIIFRRAEDKISERYLLNNSKFFHNIRLEIFIVRRVWKPLLSKFLVQRSAMLFNESEHWTAKLRFRSL